MAESKPYKIMSYTASNPFYEKELRGSFARQSLMTSIGASLIRVEPGLVEISLPYREDLTQQHGYLHAGILATIADSACGYAAYTLMPAGSEVLSVEFKINLLRPAIGKSFLARGEVVRPGKTVTVVNASVFAHEGSVNAKLIATMQGTMICIKSR